MFSHHRFVPDDVGRRDYLLNDMAKVFAYLALGYVVVSVDMSAAWMPGTFFMSTEDTCSISFQILQCLDFRFYFFHLFSNGPSKPSPLSRNDCRTYRPHC
jgi:hypothetical protein